MGLKIEKACKLLFAFKLQNNLAGTEPMLHKGLMGSYIKQYVA